MPRTKYRKGFSPQPIIALRRLDCFGGFEYGMVTQLVSAREIVWPHAPLNGEGFLLHKVPGHYNSWTITHKNSGLSIMEGGAGFPSEKEAKREGQKRIRVIGDVIVYLLTHKHIYSPTTEKQMISLSRKVERNWGGIALDPTEYIQKEFITEEQMKLIPKKTEGRK